jgi:2-succinyl-6-hydroxy-2,4-cyclohexadiene-1-carboxylate synthase
MTVVFVHGFTQTAASWRPVDALLDETFDRRLLDVPGGLDFVATASALGDAGGRATYVGYSMGGRLCLQLALDRPDVVERLVLVSASPGIADADERAARRASDEQQAQEIERDGVDAFLEHWLTQPMFATVPPEHAGLADRKQANTVETLTHQLRVLGQGAQPDNWPRLHALGMPALLLAGALDAKYMGIAQGMGTQIADARVDVIPDAGHACHLEQPAAVAHAVTSWLRTR